MFSSGNLAGSIAQARRALIRCQARGDYSQALSTLDAFTRLAHAHHFPPYIIAIGAVVRAQIVLAQDNLAAAVSWTDASGLSVDDELTYPCERAF